MPVPSDTGAWTTVPFWVGDWRVDPKSREVDNGIRPRRLSPRALSVLCILAEANGKVVARRDLLDAVWPDVTVGEESLTTAVSELRRILGDGGKAPRILETVPRVGYRLAVPVVTDADPMQGRSDTSFSLEAYSLVMEARRLRERGETGSVVQAAALSAEACRLAPSFAVAHAQSAMIESFRHLYAGGGTASVAFEAAERACRLRPDLAICHAAMGYALYALGRSEDALQAFSRAISLDPNDIDTPSIAKCALFSMGKWHMAASFAERSALLKPDDYVSLGIAARAVEATGDCRRATVLAIRAGERARAAMEADPTAQRSLYVLATVQAMLGDRAEAEALIASAGPMEPAFDFYTVLTLARLGAVSEALDRLTQAVENGWRHGLSLMTEPLLAPLRGEVRYNRMVDLLTE